LPIINPATEIFHGWDGYGEGAITTLLHVMPAHVAILRPGGIGKTSIALTILHDPRIQTRFSDHQYVISCKGILSSASLVDTICTTFGLVHFSTNKQE
jgi:hypothetical protein